MLGNPRQLVQQFGRKPERLIEHFLALLDLKHFVITPNIFYMHICNSISLKTTVSKSVLFETAEFTTYIIAKDFYKVQPFSDFFISQGLFETFSLPNDSFCNILLQSQKVRFLRLLCFAQFIAQKRTPNASIFMSYALGVPFCCYISFLDIGYFIALDRRDIPVWQAIGHIWVA